MAQSEASAHIIAVMKHLASISEKTEARKEEEPARHSAGSSFSAEFVRPNLYRNVRPKPKLWKLARNYLIAAIMAVWVAIFWPLLGYGLNQLLD